MNTRRILILAAALVLLLTGGQAALAAPYDSYHFNYWTDAVPAPASYLPSVVIDDKALGGGALLDPQDMSAGDDGRLYVADTGHKRIVVLDREWRVERIIGSFDRGGKQDGFVKPTGIDVTSDGTIYVADADGSRIVVLANDGTFLRQISDPKSEVLPQGFVFNPVKVGVDAAGRVYTVARNVFEGIMQFDSDGSFIGYLGTNSVAHNPYDTFWKKVSTKAQREQMVLFVPTEFSNLDVDPINFVLATNIDKNSDQPIKRLNPSGKDVLKRYGVFPVRGDLYWPRAGADKSGPSIMMDIKSGPDGSYSALDQLRGRIFTYDEEGNLLYIFGQTGSEQGTFKNATALERVGDNFIVLDAGYNRITLFTPTAYGSYINQATHLNAVGKGKEAAQMWENVLGMNANFELAYNGIGKSLLREHRYKEAMDYFKLGMNRQYYSTAFSLYRKQWARQHAGDVLTGIVLLVAAAAGYGLYRKLRNRRLMSSAA